MRFNSAAFDKFLTDIGQRVEWRRSYACPCVSQTSGQPDPKHALCSGKGRLWDAAISTVVGMANQKTQAQWAAMGQYEIGDMVLSVPQISPMWDAGQFDRILLVNSTNAFSMPLVRGSMSERLLFQVSSINRCFWLDPVLRTVVEGGIPSVDSNGNLAWTSDAPPNGYTYSLSGEKYDEYFIFGAFPSDRNEHKGMRLPKRTVARQWDLFGR